MPTTKTRGSRQIQPTSYCCYCHCSSSSSTSAVSADLRCQRQRRRRRSCRCFAIPITAIILLIVTVALLFQTKKKNQYSPSSPLIVVAYAYALPLRPINNNNQHNNKNIRRNNKKKNHNRHHQLLLPLPFRRRAVFSSSTNNKATADDALDNNNNHHDDDSKKMTTTTTTTNTTTTDEARARSTMYMTMAMSLHYGGYEFIRNSCLAMFTSSSTTGFAQYNFAFPLAYALVSPFSILFLYVYGKLLDGGGPRYALQQTTWYSIIYVIVSSFVLFLGTTDQPSMLTPPLLLIKMVVGVSFLFQNSYTYMLSTQQWSFVDSVVLPQEATKWFGWMTGVGSITCVITAGLVPILLPYLGLIGLYGLTSITLLATLLLGDRAYQIAETYGFDPAKTREDHNKNNSKKKQETIEGRNRIQEARQLFGRVPTLRALFTEVIAFQTLNTVLNVSMMRALPMEIPNDMDRSAFTGKYYAAVSAVSAIFQFLLLPTMLKYLKPKHIWRLMPVLPLLVCLYQVVVNNGLLSSSLSFLPAMTPLHLLASALFLMKVMDYSLRSVVYNMVYQPLDFESRFVGKEIIGVFGSRMGKSGMSLFLSGMSAMGGFLGSLTALTYCSVAASSFWLSGAWWLSRMLPEPEEAQRMVEQRQKSQQEQQRRQEKDKDE